MSDQKGILEPGNASLLEREIGLGVMTFYAVGVMIGGGIYVLIGEVAGLAGYWTPFIFAFAGIAAGLSAASFAELSARMPEAGGSATFTLHGFGSKHLSLIVGIAVASTGILSAGAVLQGGVGYMQGLIDAPAPMLIILIGTVLTVLAVWGTLESLSVAASLALIEIVGLLIVVVAAFSASPQTLDPSQILGTGVSSGLPLPEFSFITATSAIVLAFFAFIGFEDVVNMAEEARNPSRTMPLALLYSFIIVIVIYGFVAIAALKVVSPAGLRDSTRPLALVYENATGRSANFISAIGVAAALNGVLAQIIMSARILLSLGRRTPALSWFGTTHHRLKTPIVSTLFAGTIIMMLALTVKLEGLAEATSLILLGVFILINLALIRIKEKSAIAPFILPSWVPWAGALISGAILIGAILR